MELCGLSVWFSSGLCLVYVGGLNVAMCGLSGWLKCRGLCVAYVHGLLWFICGSGVWLKCVLYVAYVWFKCNLSVCLNCGLCVS